MKHEISLIDIDICNLNCINCPKHNYDNNKVSSLIEFKKYVKRAIELGFTKIGLTPFYGDPFIISNYFDKLDYLESVEEITHISSATNLLAMCECNKFCIYSKLELSVSFYGKDEDSYYNRTGKNYFKKFIKNLKKLNEYCKTNKYTTKFIVQNRIIDSTGSEDILNLIPDLIFEIDNRGIIDKEYNSDKKYIHSGVCNRLFKDNIVMPDGKLSYCCWHPYIKEFDGGDFLTNNNHSKLINLILNQKAGKYNKYCESCSDFEKVSKDDIVPCFIGDIICKLI